MPTALLASAGAAAAGLVAAARYRLPAGPPPALDPSRHWPDAPSVAAPDAAGPVLVLVEYRIDAARVGDFLRSARLLREGRLRDGAVRLDLFADAADPGRLVETFLVESWAEYLRQHGRVTAADRAVKAAVRTFHTGGAPPRVTHLLTPGTAPGDAR